MCVCVYANREEKNINHDSLLLFTWISIGIWVCICGKYTKAIVFTRAIFYALFYLKWSIFGNFFPSFASPEHKTDPFNGVHRTKTLDYSLVIISFLHSEYTLKVNAQGTFLLNYWLVQVTFYILIGDDCDTWKLNHLAHILDQLRRTTRKWFNNKKVRILFSQCGHFCVCVLSFVEGRKIASSFR